MDTTSAGDLKVESQLIPDLINHQPPLRLESCFWFRGRHVQNITRELATSVLTNLQSTPLPSRHPKLQDRCLAAQAGPSLGPEEEHQESAHR